MRKYDKLVTQKGLAKVGNYGAIRNLNNLKFIVIHYTANDGDNAINNMKYFQNNIVGASAHFFVDDNDIAMSVELNRVANHCGGNVYKDIKSTGGGKLYKICTNTNSIAIEVCDTIRDGKYGMSEKTRANVIKLVRALMEDFNIGVDNVIRHFDVTGKYCPRYYCLPYGSNKEWEKFKKEISGDVDKGVTKPVLEYKVGDKVRLKSDAKQYTGGSIRTEYKDKEYIINSIGNDRAVLSLNGTVMYAVNVDSLVGVKEVVQEVVKKAEFKVRIDVDKLNYRQGPGTSYKVLGSLPRNLIYTIVEESGSWGKLKSGAGWINLNYVKRL